MTLDIDPEIRWEAEEPKFIDRILWISNSDDRWELIEPKYLDKGRNYQPNQTTERSKEYLLAVGMAVTIRERLLTRVPKEIIHPYNRSRMEDFHEKDEVAPLLVEYNTPYDLAQAFIDEDTRVEFLSALEKEGQQFQEEHSIKYENHHPIEIGYIIKTNQVIYVDPSEVSQEIPA